MKFYISKSSSCYLQLIFKQAVAQEQKRKSVGQVLVGSLMLLDVCGTAKQKNARKDFNRFRAEDE
ncbi:hypothetical protein J1N35_029558, partial [Gossypium stocksii]